MRTLNHTAAVTFLNTAKEKFPTAQFWVGFYKYNGQFRDMLCTFDFASEHKTAVYGGMATVLDAESGQIRSFRIERMAYIRVEQRIWLIENDKGECPRVHKRHLETA